MKNYLLKNKSNIKHLFMFYLFSCIMSYTYFDLYCLIDLKTENSVFMPIGFVAMTGVVIMYFLLKLVFPKSPFMITREVPFGLRFAGLVSISGIMGFFTFVPYFVLGKGLYYSGFMGLWLFLLPPALMIHVYAYLYLMYKNDKKKFKNSIKLFLNKILFVTEEQNKK